MNNHMARNIILTSGKILWNSFCFYSLQQGNLEKLPNDYEFIPIAPFNEEVGTFPGTMTGRSAQSVGTKEKNGVSG